MQRFKHTLLSLVALTALGGAILAGCTQSSSPKTADTSVQGNKKYAEEELGLRKESLYKEDAVMATPTLYSERQPGTGKVIDRAFENAPPMIPHSVDGMLPITRDNNMCTSCHMPEVAPSVGATSIPKSHFMTFRPKTTIGKEGEMIVDGKKVDNTSDVKTAQHDTGGLHQGRFNCSQCHAPQSNVPLAVANEFQAEFRKQGADKKSNLVDVLNEGVK